MEYQYKSNQGGKENWLALLGAIFAENKSANDCISILMAASPDKKQNSGKLKKNETEQFLNLNSLTEKDMEDIIQKRLEGIQWKDLAKEYGVLASSLQGKISTYCKEHKKEYPKLRKSNLYNFTKEQIRDMIKLHDSGISYQKIADKYGVSDSVIKRRLTNRWSINS